MRELLKTNDPVLISLVEAVLSGEGIAVLVADQHMSALEGSVGVYLRREAIKWKRDTVSASDGTTTFGTNVQSDPWALFVNNISAFYYF